MQQTAAIQKKENDKTSVAPVSPIQQEHVPDTEDMIAESGVPLFLQRFPTSSLTPPLQRDIDEEKEEKEAAIFPKLTVGQPDDEYEREADEVANQVMRMPVSVLQRKRAGVQSKEANGGLSKTHLHAASRIHPMQSDGRPLPESARSYFEPRFGHDFSKVRVHTGPHAANASKLINAKAFTVGPHIVFGAGQLTLESYEGRKLLAHELAHVVQQSCGDVNRTLHRRPDIHRKASGDTRTTAAHARRVLRNKRKGAKSKNVPLAKELIKSTYPYLAEVLLPEHLQAVQEVIDWRSQNRKIGKKIADFDRREREKAAREGMSGDSYRYLSSYNTRLERLQGQRKEAPTVFRIEVDTSRLIDPLILKAQDWNVQAEKEFRESWVRALISKPTVLEICSDINSDEIFRGIFWNGRALPTEGGLITWNKLLEIPGAFLDYNSRVLHSPIALAAKENLQRLRSCYETTRFKFDFECERKSEYPAVSAISEFFSSEIDWNAASRLLPEGKNFSEMSFSETLEFLSSIDRSQLEKIKRVLPSYDEVHSVYKHLLHIDTAVTLGRYEAALITMPLVADEIEEMYRKVITYSQRTTEGASRVITGLQLVRTGCNIILTVGGGVMGKAYGLVGISAGSAAGAGIGTFTQETAMQLSEGRLDPGSILFKTGKDAATTFLFSMIGGALGSKFAGMLGPRLAKIIPNEGVRIFVIGRVADASSGILTTPLEAVVTRMLEGKWPKSKDLLLDMVVNAAVGVIIGGAVDIITGVPNLKGRAWDSLVETDIRVPKQGRETGPFSGLSDAEIEAALQGKATTGTMVRGPAGADTAKSLVDLKVVSRLNDQVRALVTGHGTTEHPTGTIFEISQTEVKLAQKILSNPNSSPDAVNQALEVVVARAVADFRVYSIGKSGGLPTEAVLTADRLRGSCGIGRDLTADSIASLTIGSKSPLVVHRIQANHLGINAQHAFTVIIKPNGEGFIVDPTFAQFADQIGGATFTSERMLADPRTASVARNLLRDGFIPLTTANAHDYALGLGARIDQAEVVAARIRSGDASILTEVILNGTIIRQSSRPGEAYNTLLTPIDVDTPEAGSIQSIEKILVRLGPDDPARPGLSSLRDRLMMISAKQQQVTSGGIGVPR